ncbi:MAG: acyl-CoA dehydrogenase family protein [Desulfobacterales bacterium]
MDFDYGEKAEKLRSEIREFVKKNVPQNEAIQFAEEHHDHMWDHGMNCAKKLAEKGWLTMKWPKEYGGQDAPVWEQVVLAEEAGYWGIPGLGMGVSGTKWVGPSLMLFGTEEQKKKYLPKIAAAEAEGVWCTGYSEPDSGSDHHRPPRPGWWARYAWPTLRPRGGSRRRWKGFSQGKLIAQCQQEAPGYADTGIGIGSFTTA